jgi:Putative beta barrel porin-7 (BBP7)
MKFRARWFASLLAGLGPVCPSFADSEPSDPTPVRRYETTAPNGLRKRVIEILPVTEVDAPPAPVAAPTPALIVEPGFAESQGRIIWAQADFLQWWYRGGSVPPLVTAGSPLDPIPGALAQPGTRVLYGGGQAETQWASGGRGRIGGYVDGSPLGWDVGGFYLLPQTTSGLFSSAAGPVLARPFYDAFLVTPSSLLFGAAGAFQGSVTVTTRTSFWGLEANASVALDGEGKNTVFVGYRYLQMTDDLQVSGRYNLDAGGLAFINGLGLLTGATGNISDRVKTTNEFNGATLGWKYHGGFGRAALDLRASVAVGVGSERVRLEGLTQTADADGTPRSAASGLLVQASNAGVYGRDLMTVVPEVGARLSYMVAPGISLFGGYDFLYWASVMRAGDQLDHVIDTRQLPSSGNFVSGAPGFRPISPLRDSAFWAHGVSVGVQFEY